MKNLVKVLCLVLALVMMIGFCACDTTPSESSAPADESKPADESTPADESKEESKEEDKYNLDELLPTEGEEVEDVEEYTIKSREVYKEQLGDFYKAYLAACEETNVSKRYAMMALAEAKLMESAVMFPTTTSGGNYAIGRVAPYSVSTVMWGNDSDRYHQILVTEELMKPADRNEMKAKWAELKGTGTYEAWAKEFLKGKGYTLKDTYSIGYSSDPKTWDALNTSRSADSEAIVNTYDCLVEYDNENIMQPALAKSWEISDDELTYTFTIRDGAVWVDSQGRKVADVCADDFVAGMQHMLDAEGGLSWLIEGKVVGVSEYLADKSYGMENVGVKADGNKVVYTLVEPCSYFMTMLTYNLFAPMSRTFYESKGGKFGADYDASAADYTYGTNPENIAYCGPYLVANATAENTIVFQANENYWNKDAINVKTINWYYNDGSDALKAYNDMKAGKITSCGLNASAVEQAKTDGLYDEYSYISGTDSTSYMGFLNIYRTAFTNINDDSNASPKTDAQKAQDANAYANVHFRRAICMALDRGTYNAQSVGEELKYVSLRNSYVPGVFAALDEDVTVSINGTETTFAKGTYYGAIEQAQLDADGVKIKVWDPNGDNGIGSGDGFDGWYNVDNAKAEFKLALEELAAAGIEVSKSNPIYLDYNCYDASTTWKNRGNVVKQCIEAATDGCVIVNLNTVTQEQFYYAGYYTEYGNEANYDVYDLSGWGPDYGDPSTYLDTFLPEYAGYMIKCIGIY